MKEGLTEGGTRPIEAEACACAEATYSQFSVAFSNWYEDKSLIYIHPDALNAALENEFSTLEPVSSCTIIADNTLMEKIRVLMVNHFVETALNGWQFERFEEAWCAWLKENALL